MKKHVYVILLVLLASMMAVGCTGSNTEKNASQTMDTNFQSKASPTQPDSSVTYQDAEWIASVQKQYPILKTDFDRMSNVTNQYNISTMNNCDPDEITKYGQNLIDDAQKALEENNKYAVSTKLQSDQEDWETTLHVCNSAGNSWVLIARDIKNGRDLNNTTNDSNLVSALGSTGAAAYNMKRVTTSLGST